MIRSDSEKIPESLVSPRLQRVSERSSPVISLNSNKPEIKKIVMGLSGVDIRRTLNKIEEENTRDEMKKDNANIYLTLSDGSNIRVKCSSSLTPQRVKHFVLDKALQLSLEVPSKNPNDYIFKIFGLDHLIDRNNQQLTKLSFFKLCKETYITPR